MLYGDTSTLIRLLLSRHLARFKFTPTDASKSSPVKVEVYRSDPSATRPFFSATIHPINYLPTFPMSSTWLSYLGISTAVLQPPLPEGDPADVVVGTKDWKRSYPKLKTRTAKMVWIDMKQPDKDRKAGESVNGPGEGAAGKGYENWWPGMGRWHLGMVCEDSTLELGEPEVLSG